MKKNRSGIQSKRLENILHEKERNGLRTQILARIGIIIVTLPFTMILAQSDFERILSSIIVMITVTTAILFLLLLRKYRNLTAIGVSGAVIDVAIVSCFTVIWYLSVGGTKVPASFMTKNMVTLLSIVVISISSMAIRPLYPMIVTAGTIMLHGAIYLYAVSYPGVEFTDDYYEAFTTAKLSYNAMTAKLLWLIVSGSFITWLTHTAQKTIISAATAERTSAQLGRFFSPNVADAISRSDDDFARIGGTVRDVAVMFSDIRNFTALSEKLPPGEVLEFLSEYHEIMVAIIFKHGGTLDKFIGDAIMATFGTPVAGRDDALRSVRAAIEMNDALAAFNKDRKARDLFAIEHGIGIHYGPALVGNIGTRERLEYTVLGDTVNVASRIEGLCKEVGETLLFSDAVASFLGSEIKTRPAGKIRVRGKSEELAVFTAA